MTEKYLIRVADTAVVSYTLQGKSMSVKKFKKWIEQAENTNTITLKKAKNKWATKKEQLLKLIK